MKDKLPMPDRGHEGTSDRQNGKKPYITPRLEPRGSIRPTLLGSPPPPPGSKPNNPYG